MVNSFTIGPITIHLYGIIIMFGALMAAVVASREVKRRGMSTEWVWDMLPWLLIAGVIGARLWHIFTPPASMVERGITTWYYLTHPLDAIAIWKGGLGIPGAVMGGALALYIYCRKKGLSFAAWVDIIAPGLALAQAIGRFGNFVNQEVYGAPTDLPWAIFIEPLHRLPEFSAVEFYHPLFAYEAIYNLLNMTLLLWVGRKFAGRLQNGDIFLIYLVVYPVGRFMLEFLRLDPSPVAGININQVIMAIIAIGAAVALILRHRAGTVPAKPAPMN
ncbi:MAG: prolipoprotein diacylglyceryl transferase [Chloroflexota bacterium]|jgi:phosphatidylglycerol:prolipoprotein diacylglycerol transferase